MDNLQEMIDDAKKFYKEDKESFHDNPPKDYKKWYDKYQKQIKSMYKFYLDMNDDMASFAPEETPKKKSFDQWARQYYKYLMFAFKE